ncbi:MAG: hypothetical protein ACE5KM_18545, partial [Planctomycetaceae bacterium]
GFRGNVHPAISRTRSLDAEATCSRIGTGRGFANGYFPQQFRGPFDRFSVARPVATYSAREFSAFLPKTFEQVGQIWDVDMDRVSRFLRQFHSGASIRLEAPGRRGGPNGGFAVLRATSATHYDILARVHAEFRLAPGTYLTPAYFEVRLLIDRRNGVVRGFTFSLPTEKSLNATLTAVLPSEALIDIVHLDRMDLRGGDLSALESSAWTREITPAEARKKLRGAFYKFDDIQWVKPERAVAEARKQDRPILAIVLWGDLDDQSC